MTITICPAATDSSSPSNYKTEGQLLTSTPYRRLANWPNPICLGSWYREDAHMHAAAGPQHGVLQARKIEDWRKTIVEIEPLTRGI